MRNNTWSRPLIWSLIFAFIINSTLLLLFPGAIRPDETFQYMEPAFRLVTGHDVMTWEWRSGIRSWLIPGTIAGILQLSSILNLGYSVVLVKFVFATLSLGLVALFVWLGWLRNGLAGAWACGISAAFWPDIAHASFRTLSETIGGNALVCGALLGEITLDRHYLPVVRTRFFLIFSTGLLLGLSIAIRFQFAPAAAMAGSLLAWRIRGKNIIPLALGFTIPIILLGIVDGMTLDYPYQSIVENFYENIIQNIAKNKYGRSNPFFYILMLASYWGAASIFILYFFLKGFLKEKFLSFLAIWIIFYHSLIAHKEFSFIYPAIPLIIIVASVELSRHFNSLSRRQFVFCLCAQATAMICVLSGTYVDRQSAADAMIRMQILANAQPDMCGLMLVNNNGNWGRSGGYSRMTKARPLYLQTEKTASYLLKSQYNYVISEQDYPIFEPSAKEVKCTRSVCLYKIENSCTGRPDYTEFSRALKDIGM